ncbi:MAG: hypothetical protein ACP6IS_05685 [Candidatus Asgardarchaeia archaeon]
MQNVNRLKRKIRKILRKKNVVMLIDSRSVDINGLDRDMMKIRKVIDELGRLIAIKIFIEGNIEEPYIKKALNEGWVPVIVPSDVDIYLAMELTEYSFNKKISSVLISTNDVNLLPAMVVAKENGKKIFLVKFHEGENALDKIVDATIEPSLL